MNFRIAKKEFLDALSLCSRAISSTTPLPALSGIKFSVTENSLTLTASDSNISIKTSINNNDNSTLIINETGEVVLEAKYILEIVRKIDGDFAGRVRILFGQTLVLDFGTLMVLLLPVTWWLFIMGIAIIAIGFIWLSC